MNKSVIISGEASETDSEDEGTNNKPSAACMKMSVQGAIIIGEDSESEDEGASISSAVSALNQSKISEKVNEVKETDAKYNSLLHKKLRECNTKLHTDVEVLCESVCGDAQRNLNSIDQQLLRSQLTVQAAVSSLRNLSINSNALKNKLHSLLSAKFIPNINVTVNK